MKTPKKGPVLKWETAPANGPFYSTAQMPFPSIKKNRGLVYLVLQLLVLLYSLTGVCSKLAAGEKFFRTRFCLYYGLVLFISALYAIGLQ